MIGQTVMNPIDLTPTRVLNLVHRLPCTDAELFDLSWNHMGDDHINLVTDGELQLAESVFADPKTSGHPIMFWCFDSVRPHLFSLVPFRFVDVHCDSSAVEVRPGLMAEEEFL